MNTKYNKSKHKKKEIFGMKKEYYTSYEMNTNIVSYCFEFVLRISSKNVS